MHLQLSYHITDRLLAAGNFKWDVRHTIYQLTSLEFFEHILGIFTSDQFFSLQYIIKEGKLKLITLMPLPSLHVTVFCNFFNAFLIA